VLLAPLLLGVLLGGCSDLYYDRRETVFLGAGDANASNMVAQMADPWPRYVGDKNIAFNGQRMQAAAERYRRHEVIRPVPLINNGYAVQSPPVPLTTEHVVEPAPPGWGPAVPVAGAGR
jgi:hypothetical protein